MQIDNHECYIGLFHYEEHSDLVTLKNLESEIRSVKEFNNYIKNDPPLYRATWALKKEWTLEDYADKRKNTNLHRFNFCPVCGKAIDWKIIKNIKNNNGEILQ